MYCFCCKCFVVVFLYDIFLESLYWVNEKKIEEYLLMLFLVYILGFVLLYLNEIKFIKLFVVYLVNNLKSGFL